MKINLENLLKINKLQRHISPRQSVQRLLQGVACYVKGTRFAEISGQMVIQMVIEYMKKAEQLYKVVSAWIATDRPVIA